MADDLGSQLSVQQQINKVLADRNQILAKQAKILGTQVRLAAEYCKALDCKELAGMSDRLGEINEGLQQVAVNAAPGTEETNRLAEAAKKGAAGFDEMASNATKFAVAAIAFKAVQAGLKSMWGTVTNIASAFWSVISTIYKLGKALISIPFQILGNLIGMAQSGGGGGGSNPVKEALESVRKEFGNLARGEALAVTKSIKAVESQMNNLAGTGLKMAEIYGKGKKGVAAAIKATETNMKALGAAAHRFSAEIGAAPIKLDMFKRALSTTDAQFQAMADYTGGKFGKTLQETFTQVGSMAIQMGDRFGIGYKEVAKGMQTMIEDFENFGHLAPKTLASITVYAKKLGIEVKSLGKLIDGWNNFEDVAKGAAQLSQAFGMNIDAMQMMREEDPAARLRMLQDAFQATGRSIDQMSIQEKKLLAQQAKLDVKTVERAFSQEGMALSYEDITSAGEDAEASQLSQAQAMAKLAGSIDKLTGGGGGGGGKKFKSFFDAFITGFGDGIMAAKPFKDILTNISKALEIVNKAGEKVGAMFVEHFPGVKKMMEGLAKLFDPEKFQKLMDKVTEAFTIFFQTIDGGEGSGMGFDGLMARLKAAFEEFFGDHGEALTLIQDGAEAMVKALGSVFAQIAIWVVPELTKGIKAITSYLKGEGMQSLEDDSLAKQAGDVFMDLFGETGEMLKTVFVEKIWPELKPALCDLWKEIKREAEEWWETNGDTVWLGVFALMLQGLVTALASFASGIFTLLIGKWMLGGFSKEPGMFTKLGDWFGNKWKGFKDGASRLMTKSGEAFSKGWTRVSSAFSSGWKSFKGGMSRMGGWLSRTWSGFTKSTSSLMSRAGGAMSRGWSTMSKVASKGAAPVLRAVGAVGPKLLKVIPGVGIAVAIAEAGMNIGDQLKKNGAMYKERFGEQEGILAAGTAGIVDTLTLGFMPDDIVRDIGIATGKIAKKVSKFMEDIGLKPVFDVLISFMNVTFCTVAGLWDIIAGIFTLDADRVLGGFDTIGNGLWDLAKSVAAFLIWPFELLWDAITYVYDNIGDGFDWLKCKINKGVDAMGKWFDELGKKIGKKWDELWKSAEKKWDDFWIAIDDGIEKMSKLFTNLKKSIIKTWDETWKRVDKFFTDMKEGINKRIDKAIEKFVELKDRIGESLSKAWGWVTGIWGRVGEWFGCRIDEISDYFSKLPDRIGKAASCAWDALSCVFTWENAQQLGKDVACGLLNMILWLPRKMAEVGTDIWNALKAPFVTASPSKKAIALGEDITDGLMIGLESVKAEMHQIGVSSLEMLKKTFGADNVYAVLTPMVEAFKDMFVYVYDFIDDLFADGIFPSTIVEGTQKAIVDLGAVISTGFDVFFKVMDKVLKKSTKLLGGTLETFTDMLDKGIPMFMKFAEKALGAIKKYMTRENAAKLGDAIVDGIAFALGALIEVGIVAVKSMFTAMAKWLKIASPSARASEMLGQPIGGGVSSGLEVGLQESNKAMDDFMARNKAMLQQNQLDVGVAGLDQNAKALESVGALSKGTSQLGEVLEDLNRAAPEANKGLYDSVAAIVSNIETLGGVLSGDAGKGAVEVVKAFSNGKLEVKHTLPETKVEVVVHLDKKALGNELVRTTLPGKMKIATTSG